ncbi:MAG: asparagine synthase-related protein [Candidatus Methanomethylophilaceae archaeon]
MFRYADIRDALVESVKEKVEGKEIGVAFSGGLDSGLVAAVAEKYAESVHLYTCGTDDSYDVAKAEYLSGKLGLPWTHVPISEDTVEDIIREMIPAAVTADPFTVSYEMPLFCVCRAMKEKTVLTGQGADEYFMGCAKFVNCSYEEYEKKRKSSAERLHRVSVPSEKRIAASFGKEIVYPYLDEKVISLAEKLDPSELKPEDMDSRKSVLREIASDLGYPYIAEMKKKSSQYGSKSSDLIRKAAKKKGMMFNEYVSRVYGEVLLEMRSDDVAPVEAEIDRTVKTEAEKVLRDLNMTPSEAVELFYRRIIADGSTESVKRYCHRYEESEKNI